MALLASAIMLRAAGMVNDYAQSTYNNTNLIPHLQNAQLRLQTEFNLNDLPYTHEETAALTITAGNSLTTATVPAIPTDIVHPYKMWEKPTGSSIDNYVPMTQVEDLPNRAQDTTLNEWQWREGNIYFVGATVNVDVKLSYEKTLTIITAHGDDLGDNMQDCQLYLAAQTAAFAALILGGNEGLSAANQGVADDQLRRVIANRVKEQQNLPARRLAYGYYRRARRI
ncbi:MAG: hypothetical protein ACW99U_18185 [Candidatus Thorarchaeota archaeon]|jgi:hypothetical protein